jgi:hypothetical protein
MTGNPVEQFKLSLRASRFASVSSKRMLSENTGLKRSGWPLLSLVVIAFNIPREIARTLVSLSADYQRDIDPAAYEIIVVDNGSDPALGEGVFAGLAGSFRLITMDPAHPSPAKAINRGLAEAKGDVIGILFDGARIVTPGLLNLALRSAGLHDNPVVTTIGWYLGSDFQSYAARAGYNQDVEDSLLASIDWPHDGYRLFDIATPDETAPGMGFWGSLESNALFLRRDMWSTIGGADEQFDLPGGGFLIGDMYRRAVSQPDARTIVLLGEGTFHQCHGGIATNAPPEEFGQRWEKWGKQYFALRGRFSRAQVDPTFVGKLPKPVLWRMARAAIGQLPLVGQDPSFAALLGNDFDVSIWADGPTIRPKDAAIGALVDLAQAEYRAGNYPASAAVARLARERAPDEPEPARLAALAGPWLDLRIKQLRLEEMDAERQARVHFALGKAHAALKERGIAEKEFLAAIAKQPDFTEAYAYLSSIRMPGPLYYAWLAWLHKKLKPRSLVEIGVSKGLSLALAQPPTIAIGVDPTMAPEAAFHTETHLFVETSDAFFNAGRLDGLLNGQPVAMGFIDGKHVFEQALRDFINLESCCDGSSVIILHDTVPLDEPTQSREQQTEFYTGDVWRVVLCLKELRPDLDIFTIATAPSGLTVVTNLDPQSRRLKDDFDAVIARFLDVGYDAIADDKQSALNIVANDWTTIEERLRANGTIR